MTKWTKKSIEKAYENGRRDFTYENFRELDLDGICLIDANLRETILIGADMRRANLRRADMRRANLSGANIDFSCLPLWCGSLDVRVDKRIAAQLMYHVLNVMLYSDIKIPNTRDELIDFANQIHRTDVERLE